MAKQVPYRIESQGKTTTEVEKKHAESKSQLEKRLGESGLKPEKTVFIAQYSLKSGADLSKAESTEFNVRYEDPKKAWDTVLAAATKRAKPLSLDDYTGTFKIESHYKITEGQAETSRKAHGGPSANDDGRRSSSLDSLKRLY